MTEHTLVLKEERLNHAGCTCGQEASVIGIDGALLWHATHQLWPDLNPAELATKIGKLVTDKPEGPKSDGN